MDKDKNIVSIEEICYDRKEFLNKIKLVLDNHKEYKINKEINFLSIAIDGKWGSGKTTFIKDLQKEYTNSIYFDAWKYDFLNDPFSSLVSVISNNLKGSEYGVAFKEMLKKICPDNVSINLGIISPSWNTNKYSNNEIHNWEQKVEKFQNDTSKLLENDMLLIIVDELDRCRPLFAISLIETIKHAFNIEGIIIIFSINWEQMHHSLNSQYGLIKESSEFYLDKLIDWRFPLPELNNRKYLEDLINKDCKLLMTDSEIKNDIRNFIDWIIKTQNLSSLRDVYKKFYKWFLNWKTRTIYSKKINFHLEIEKILFHFLGNGYIELDKNNHEQYSKLFTDDKYILNIPLEKNINEYLPYMTKDIPDKNIDNKIISYCELFALIKNEMHIIIKNYDLIGNYWKLISSHMKNKIFSDVINFDIDGIFEPNKQQSQGFFIDFSGQSNNKTDISDDESIKKEMRDFFIKNKNELNDILNDFIKLPDNIINLVNILLRK